MQGSLGQLPSFAVLTLNFPIPGGLTLCHLWFICGMAIWSAAGLREGYGALAGCLSWLEYCPVNKKFPGLISSWVMYRKQPIYVSLSHQCFSLSLSLSQINKHILGWGLKIKIKKRESGLWSLPHLLSVHFLLHPIPLVHKAEES